MVLTVSSARAQATGQAMLTGTVSDGTGALIRDASVHLAPIGRQTPVIQERTDRTGSFEMTALPGRYTFSVEAPGFTTYTRRALTLSASEHQSLAVRLTVAGRHEEISVTSDAEETNADDLAGSTLFQGDSLKLLSSDPTILRQQLGALAGDPGNAQFFVNGFSSDRLPPKSSIRSIRVNGNDFSAAYAQRVSSRVEIDTQPGTDQFHGSFSLSGTDQPLDAFNPYSQVHPPFYDFLEDGSFSGPLNKKTSFFAAENVEHLANSAVINAANPLDPSVLLSTSLAAPQQTETVSLRVDRQISQTNVAFARDEWSQTRIRNDGIQPLLLPEAAFSTHILTNTLQLADTQTLGAHAVNEVRFQYLRNRLQQSPNSQAPSVLVEGTFQSGGNPRQFVRDAQDTFELQNRFELDHGPHLFRAGLRLRSLRDSNSATAGFNGQYIFPDVASYLDRQPTQYSQTTGQPAAVLLDNDLGLYAEDSWKITPKLSLTFGFRFETQTAIPDHSDPAPRVMLAYQVRPGNRKTPIMLLRAGYGLFYARFPEAQLLQSVRQNGTRQVAYVAENPDFNPEGPPQTALLSAGEPTLYQVDPSLHTAYEQFASVYARPSLGRLGNLSGQFLFSHDTHEYLIRNSNAPLPGTGGVRPVGSNANIYQFASRGNGNLESFVLNYYFTLHKRLTVYGVYRADKDYADSEGADHFTANPYNIKLDYGRSATDRAQSYTGGLDATLPYGVHVTPFLAAHSGIPFDITTGTDLNGDTLFNDRPAFATASSGSSLVRTGYGSFDVAPSAGERLLPRNYGTSPGLVWLQLQVSKDVHLGPRPSTAISATGKPGPQPDRPWDLSFSVEVQNVLNHNNPGLPVGQIGASPCTSAGCSCSTASATNCPLAPSPYFGHSLSLANDFSPNTAANRTILLHTTFTW